MELAGKNLLNCLCPARYHLPIWSLNVDREYRAESRFSWPAHNIGRWWDAILRLEDATGFIVPAQLEGAMLQNLRRFFDNPDQLLLAPVDLEGVDPQFELHSLRESLLALNALVRYRNCRWAAQQGHRMLESVERILNADCTWDLDKIDYWQHAGRELPWWHYDPTQSNGRMIEALVWFYEATGDPLALELADRLARYHLAHTTLPDGRLPEASTPGHTHSYLGTLRGLLLFGLLTRQHEYVDAVAATYRVTVPQLVKESGFAAHDLGKDAGGETTSPGDAAQLALWLALDAGYAEYLDDVERIVRARLLPSQILESPALTPVVDDCMRGFIDLDDLIIGGLGGCHSMPHAGKKNVTDVTAAGLHSLIDIYSHISLHSEANTAQMRSIHVYLHFDYRDEYIEMSTERTQEARLTIVPQIRANILVRIPGWTHANSVRLTVDGRPLEPSIVGRFLLVSADNLPGKIVVTYALPERKTEERTDGVDYHFTWRGDEVVGVWPNDSFFPFYHTAPG
jgi:hypothetical protein